MRLSKADELREALFLYKQVVEQVGKVGHDMKWENLSTRTEGLSSTEFKVKIQGKEAIMTFRIRYEQT